MNTEELCAMIRERLGRRETKPAPLTDAPAPDVPYFEMQPEHRAAFEARIIERALTTRDRALIGFLAGLCWRGNCASLAEVLRWLLPPNETPYTSEADDPQSQ